MTKVLYVIVLTGFLVGGCSSCTFSQEKNDTTTQVQDGAIARNVNVDEFDKLVAGKNGLLLDVRTPKEVAEGKIGDATNIDYYESDFKENISKLDKNTPVFVYCRSGHRAGLTMNLMKDLGFKEVYNLDGGFLAWKEAGKKITK